jgi:MarR family transcriptional regulator, lower aerobic nicotinate degradation pathway regulator
MTGDPPVTALTDRAGFLLSRVGTAVQAGFKEVLARWGIRPLHFLILTALRAEAGMSQQALCRALSIDSGNMVELLDTLEELGYANRAPDANDRRRHAVTMTAVGRSTLFEIMKAVEDFDDRFLAPLDDNGRRQLVGLLTRLYAATAEGRGQGYTVVSSADGGTGQSTSAAKDEPAPERPGRRRLPK